MKKDVHPPDLLSHHLGRLNCHHVGFLTMTQKLEWVMATWPPAIQIHLQTIPWLEINAVLQYNPNFNLRYSPPKISSFREKSFPSRKQHTKPWHVSTLDFRTSSRRIVLPCQAILGSLIPAWSFSRWKSTRARPPQGAEESCGPTEEAKRECNKFDQA